MAVLDTLASRAVFAARLFERAVHDGGPWYIECLGTMLLAERICEDDRVTFTVELPDAIEGPVRMALYCRDEMVSVREVSVLDEGHGDLSLDWSLELVPAA